MIFRRTESVNSKEETEVGSQYPCTWQSLISRSCISTASQSCSSKLYYISKTDSDPPLPPPPIQSQSIYSTARIVIFGLNKLHRVLKIESVDEMLSFLVHRSSLHHSSNKHSITSAPFSTREERKKEKEEEEEEGRRKKKKKSTTSAWKEQTHASIIAWKNLKRAKEPRRIFTSETRRAVAATPFPPGSLVQRAASPLISSVITPICRQIKQRDSRAARDHVSARLHRPLVDASPERIPGIQGSVLFFSAKEFRRMPGIGGGDPRWIHAG